MKWIDITEDLTEEGKKELKVGNILMFTFEGSPLHLKIMRKAKGKVWAKDNYIYKPEEVEITDNEAFNNKNK